TGTDESAVDAAGDVATLMALEKAFHDSGHPLTSGLWHTTDTLGPKYTNQSGTVDLKTGDTVLAGGTVYVWAGADTPSVNLAAGVQNYGSNANWKTGLWVLVHHGDIVRDSSTGWSYSYKPTTAALLDLNAQTYATDTAHWTCAPPSLKALKPG